MVHPQPEPPRPPKILVVDDEESVRFVLMRALERQGYAVAAAPDLATARASLAQGEVFLVFLDLRLPDGNGLTLLDEIRERGAYPAVVVITAQDTMINAVEAMKRGADDYLPKPFDLERLGTLADSLRQKVRPVAARRPEAPPLERQLVGRSPAMIEIFKLVGKVARTDESVLLLGESGTGKELAARLIHDHSHRTTGPFVAVNTAAIPRELLESELFGYERGAFTGAFTQRQGKFEQAHGGTIFLDEIGEMPTALQTALLRVLQERELVRVGGATPVPVDVRVIAATNADLEDCVEAGTFRRDLYFRLNVLPIRLPPLRERGTDVRLLADHFLQLHGPHLRGEPTHFADDALDLLERQRWPGNVRELENVVKRAALLCGSREITGAELAPMLPTGEAAGPAVPADPTAQASLEEMVYQRLRAYIDQLDGHLPTALYESVLPQLERPLIRVALETTRGNQLRAAELLGINRNTLRKKIRLLNIDVER